jgi:aerobic-type carbon monoxide dehydrogenase small subunit (CoxS/CutS family)
MSNDHLPDHQQEHQPGEHPDPDAPTPQRGWGGEYDSDTTAFIEFPPGGHPGEAGGDPLAAPGHGYQPPDLAGPLPTPEATTDPGATGQWTMPFAYGAVPDSGASAAPAAPGGGASRAAAMGQGAAAALSGSQQGRTLDHPQDAAVDAAAAGAGPSRAWELPPQDGAAPAATVSPTPTPTPWPAETEPAERPVEPAATAATAPGAATATSRSDHPEVSYVLRVNGIDRPVSGAWIGESLLYVLRERLGLAGAKDGCSQGECGACSVQVDGRLLAACLVPAATVAGSEIRTVEGLGGDGVPSDVQRALAGSAAVQCGFCLPGMAMTVHDLLEGNHAPSELETREAISGNLCRCSGYRGVLDAVRSVVSERAASADPPGGGEDGLRRDGTEQRAATARIPHQAGPPSGDVS